MNTTDRLTFLDGFMRALDAANLITPTARNELTEDLRDIRRDYEAIRRERDALAEIVNAIPSVPSDVLVMVKGDSSGKYYESEKAIAAWLSSRAPKAEPVKDGE